MRKAILSIVKDEKSYLYDFLKYHSGMGIDVFVFEDYGSESHKDICDKFDNVYLSTYLELYPKGRRKEITLLRENGRPIKNEMLNQGLKLIKAMNAYDWVFVIDNDEYITFTEPLDDVLSRYNDYDALLIYWENYGCSGHLYKPLYDKPIYEIYTEKCGFEIHTDLETSNICKFVVNMNKYQPEMFFKIHDSDNTNWVKLDYTKDRSKIVLEPLYLRHFITKSCQEYIEKLYVRGCFYKAHRNMQSFWDMCPEYKEQILNNKEFVNFVRLKYNIDLTKKR